MHFYRELYPIFALSFDFDDTIYDNRPVIFQAEQQSLSFLRKYHPILHNIQQKDCDRFRFSLFQEDPNICHNVTTWRWRSFEYMLCHMGLSKFEARVGADSAMDIIISWRSRVKISVQMRNILSELSAKWPLVAITNGNIDPIVCGLSDYFMYIFRSGRDGKSKPYQEMYHLASKKLGLPCKNILHIGDNLSADVMGAISSGMQACWISTYVNNVFGLYTFDRRYTPHLEISSLLSLTNFL